MLSLKLQLTGRLLRQKTDFNKEYLFFIFILEEQIKTEPLPGPRPEN